MKAYLLIPILAFFVFACSPMRQIGHSAIKEVIAQPDLSAAHIGIAIFEPATNKYWYQYQSDKYFVPASNVKLPTCYAALKYLGNNLPALQYESKEDTLYIQPTGDPTFLHPEFTSQRAYSFLKNTDKPIVLNVSNWQEEPWGSGWSWDDYQETYMPERSAMPVYGNLVRFNNVERKIQVEPTYFSASLLVDGMDRKNLPPSIHRDMATNRFLINGTLERDTVLESPFVTERGRIIQKLLSDTLHRIILEEDRPHDFKKAAVLHSAPTDSFLKPMMHQSDNFFAEQSLLMVSNQLLNKMNDAAIIDTLLKTDFKELPQKPTWVDGSGLSHYNLFSPQDFIVILNKMRTEFGLERMKIILPTGNEGTIRNYYVKDSGYLYAKTGTLSGVVAFSGFLYTHKNKLLIFSVLVNNHQTSGTKVRRSVERFLEGIRKKY